MRQKKFSVYTLLIRDNAFQQERRKLILKNAYTNLIMDKIHELLFFFLPF